VRRIDFLGRELFLKLEKEERKLISAMGSDCITNPTWLGCYSISLSDYKKYKMKEHGIEGDHVPDNLDKEWNEIHWEDISNKYE